MAKTTKHEVPNVSALAKTRVVQVARVAEVNDGRSAPAQKKQAEEPASFQVIPTHEEVLSKCADAGTRPEGWQEQGGEKYSSAMTFLNTACKAAKVDKHSKKAPVQIHCKVSSLLERFDRRQKTRPKKRPLR